MLKKNQEFKWSAQARFLFYQIKKSISEAPMLYNPNYLKLFSFFLLIHTPQ